MNKITIDILLDYQKKNLKHLLIFKILIFNFI